MKGLMAVVVTLVLPVLSWAQGVFIANHARVGQPTNGYHTRSFCSWCCANTVARHHGYNLSLRDYRMSQTSHGAAHYSEVSSELTRRGISHTHRPYRNWQFVTTSLSRGEPVMAAVQPGHSVVLLYHNNRVGTRYFDPDRPSANRWYAPGQFQQVWLNNTLVIHRR